MNSKSIERPERSVAVRNKEKECVYLTQNAKYSPELA